MENKRENKFPEKYKYFELFPAHSFFYLLLHHLCVLVKMVYKRKSSFSMPNNQAFAYIMYLNTLTFAEKSKIERKLRAFPMVNKKIIEFFSGSIKIYKKYTFSLECFISLQKLSQWRHKSWFQWFISKTFCDNKRKLIVKLI